jgi:hypothetical protein
MFADFLAEMTFPAEENIEDESSNSKGNGERVIIENSKGIVV